LRTTVLLVFLIGSSFLLVPACASAVLRGAQTLLKASDPLGHFPARAGKVSVGPLRREGSGGGCAALFGLCSAAAHLHAVLPLMPVAERFRSETFRRFPCL